jgi:hypothetical protein
MIKSFFLYWVIMWIKYSLPRIRIDHMLSFNWKFLTPLALVLVMVTAILDKILPREMPIVYTLGMLAANLLIAWITLQILRTRAKSERRQVAQPRPVARPEMAPAVTEGPVGASPTPPVSSTPS